LNKSYFTNRQDRYIHFSAQPALAQYCFEFLKTFSTLSYSLLPFTASSSSQSTTTSSYSYHHEDYTLHWPDPHTHPHHIHRKAEIAISAFQAAHRKKTVPSTPASSDESHLSQDLDLTTPTQSKTNDKKVLLFPVIQAGQFNIREEESALALLFRGLINHNSADPSVKSTAETPKPQPHSRPLVDLTSGYFGLYKPYQDLILASPGVDCRVVAASPKVIFFSSE
jgi:CDP-diacylglycerol---glycerol-3-phosphate 3-phosphatidyltransferase